MVGGLIGVLLKCTLTDRIGTEWASRHRKVLMQSQHVLVGVILMCSIILLVASSSHDQRVVQSLPFIRVPFPSPLDGSFSLSLFSVCDSYTNNCSDLTASATDVAEIAADSWQAFVDPSTDTLCALAGFMNPKWMEAGLLWMWPANNVTTAGCVPALNTTTTSHAGGHTTSSYGEFNNRSFTCYVAALDMGSGEVAIGDISRSPVTCPGMGPKDCDCDGDCGGSFCQCANATAVACCGGGDASGSRRGLGADASPSADEGALEHDGNKKWDGVVPLQGCYPPRPECTALSCQSISPLLTLDDSNLPRNLMQGWGRCEETGRVTQVLLTVSSLITLLKFLMLLTWGARFNALTDTHKKGIHAHVCQKCASLLPAR